MSLCYKNKEFAMNKAEGFIKYLHKDFIDFKGDNIHFNFFKAV